MCRKVQPRRASETGSSVPLCGSGSRIRVHPSKRADRRVPFLPEWKAVLPDPYRLSTRSAGCNRACPHQTARRRRSSFQAEDPGNRGTAAPASRKRRACSDGRSRPGVPARAPRFQHLSADGSYPISRKKYRQNGSPLKSAHRCRPPLLFLKDQAQTAPVPVCPLFHLNAAPSPDAHDTVRNPVRSSPAPSRYRISDRRPSPSPPANAIHSAAWPRRPSSPRVRNCRNCVFQTSHRP